MGIKGNLWENDHILGWLLFGSLNEIEEDIFELNPDEKKHILDVIPHMKAAAWPEKFQSTQKRNSSQS